MSVLLVVSDKCFFSKTNIPSLIMRHNGQNSPNVSDPFSTAEILDGIPKRFRRSFVIGHYPCVLFEKTES
jgi:hypothetical protein